jgi:hypothetical protein
VDGVEEAYRAYGSGAAWGAFISLVMHEGLITETGVAPAAWPPPGQDGPAGGEDTAPRDPIAEAEQKTAEEVFFLRMLKPFTRYVPDVEQLREAGPRIVVAVGEASGDEIAKRAAIALAEHLGRPALEFPGHHGGPVDEPQSFAAAVRRAIS